MGAAWRSTIRGAALVIPAAAHSARMALEHFILNVGAAKDGRSDDKADDA